MKDMGHRACIESALNFEKPERTPFCNFADIAMMGSAGINIAEARQNAKVSTQCAVRYAKMTKCLLSDLLLHDDKYLKT